MAANGKVSPDQLIGILESYASGSSIVEIALDNDLSPAGVWYHLAKAGAKMRPPGRKPTGRRRGGRTHERSKGRLPALLRRAM